MSKSLVVGSHHLAREFALLGHSVLHICTPVTPAHLLRRSARERVAAWKRGVIRHRENLQEIVPLALVPWQISRYFGLSAYVRSTLRLQGQIRRAGFGQPDLLLVDEPRMVGICEMLRAKQTIYRATDLYAVMRSDPSVNVAERAALGRADAMIATSGPVLEHLRSFDAGKPALVIENGVDATHFSTPQPIPALYRELPHPRLLYVGTLDHRFDFEVINSLARLAPELQVVIAGPARVPIERLQATLPNLLYLGPVAYEDVPALMQHADIGLLPLNDEPSNRGRSPMKFYEYAAAGLPVVARKTPELERRAGRFIHLYKDVETMLSLIRQILAAKPVRSEIAESAIMHSWSGKALQVLEFAANLPR
jgi:glycosyltransferase involved in cell wall biosynthesis